MCNKVAACDLHYWQHRVLGACVHGGHTLHVVIWSHDVLVQWDMLGPVWFRFFVCYKLGQ